MHTLKPTPTHQVELKRWGCEPRVADREDVYKAARLSASFRLHYGCYLIGGGGGEGGRGGASLEVQPEASSLIASQQLVFHWAECAERVSLSVAAAALSIHTHTHTNRYIRNFTYICPNGQTKPTRGNTQYILHLLVKQFNKYTLVQMSCPHISITQWPEVNSKLFHIMNDPFKYIFFFKVTEHWAMIQNISQSFRRHFLKCQ